MRVNLEMDAKPCMHFYLSKLSFNYSNNSLLDAQIVVPCGHSFCSSCVEEMKESTRASSCQLCRQTVDAIYPNQEANSMLSTLKGSCR